MKTEKQGWRVLPSGVNYWSIADDRGTVASCYVQEHAKLIAAAPDMLAALQALCENRNPMYMKSEDFFARVDAGLAAIAKATT